MVTPLDTQEFHTKIIKPNLSEHIQREMDDIVAILDDRVGKDKCGKRHNCTPSGSGCEL